MIHNKFDIVLRFLVGGLLLAVAACDESETAKTDTAETVNTPVAESEASATASAEQAEGITWGDITYGAADAPVTLIEYASLTCPHCAHFATEIFPKIEENYIATGKVKLIYRNFLLNRVDMAASTVARCGDEETAKKLMKVFFSRQAEWMREKDPVDGLAALARRTVNMSRTTFDRCLSNTEMHKHLVKMTTDGKDEFEITGTPTIIVDGTVQEKYEWDDLAAAIEDAL
ncbi:thioredoxin domain-containing protein [Kordiimonas pumila]|uniref:Thioredoxin domain-containing protein n=1 Tax=Kordiimonas pumila TaxID=2161677 RepID=A0ABV7D803_9PROT|nr:thioredoxin domain-containing protein [Kordiimonas pumila]